MSLAGKIRRKTATALTDYCMLRENDTVLVAVSGGIDSSVLLVILEAIRRKSPMRFSLQPVLLNQGFPDFDPHLFQEWVKDQGFDLTVLYFDTYRLIGDAERPNTAACQICSRMRRGILYTYASKNGFSKIALGHHRDDLNETLLLNMMFSGKLAGMPPKLTSGDGRNTIIRPLSYVPRDLIEHYANELAIPILENGFCREKPDSARDFVRQTLKDLNQINPKISGSLLTAQKNIQPSQLLDKDLWSFSDYPA